MITAAHARTSRIALSLLALVVAGCGDDAPVAPPDAAVVDMARADLGTDAPAAPDLGGCRDEDGDGVTGGASPCGGDCDDANASRYPGADEVCDGDDEDCNESTLGPDGDGDGFPYAGCCNGPTNCGTDCDDRRATVNETAIESCNGVDDDCDGSVDDGVLATACFDIDGDARGELVTAAMGCSTPIGATTVCSDCDDADPSRHVGATELCNGIDDNCNGVVDDACACMMGATRPCGTAVGACMIGVQGCPSGTWETACTGGVFPMVEVCNGVDDDCDGTTDEGVTFAFYADCDVDGYGDSARSATQCMRPIGVPPGCPGGFWSMTGGDCDDSDATRNPRSGCVSDGGVADAGGVDSGGPSIDAGMDGGAAGVDSGSVSDAAMDGSVADYSGNFSISPSPSENCAFGMVNYTIGSMAFTYGSGILSVMAGSFTLSQPGATSVTGPTAGAFDASHQLSGGCTQTYRVVGTFSDLDNFVGTWTSAYVDVDGFSCAFAGCTPITVAVTGVRIP